MVTVRYGSRFVSVTNFQWSFSSFLAPHYCFSSFISLPSFTLPSPYSYLHAYTPPLFPLLQSFIHPFSFILPSFFTITLLFLPASMHSLLWPCYIFPSQMFDRIQIRIQTDFNRYGYLKKHTHLYGNIYGWATVI